MILIHASLPIDPEHREEALELAERLVEQSNAEDGIVDYRVATDVVDPNTFRFIERYENEAALEAHTETEHFRAFEERLPELLAGDPEALQFDVDAPTELEL